MATLKHDIERFFRDLQNRLIGDVSVTVQNKPLNDFITEINTELGAPLMKLIPDSTDAYVFQVMTSRVINLDPFVFYYLENPDSTPVGPDSLTRYKANLEIAFASWDNENDIGFLMLRYLRALREWFQYHWQFLGDYVELKVRDLAPADLSLLNQDMNHKIIGIGMEVVIGGP